MKALIVIAPTFADAERTMADRILPAGVDWRWFTSRRIALDWLVRCQARGVVIDPTWMIPVTAKRRAAA